MKNIIHSVENKFFVREEENGLTVYERKTNVLRFYENLTWNDVLKEEAVTYDTFKSFLVKNNNKFSYNIKSKYPFNINWMIEDKCNLDCIYCFANDKFNLRDDRKPLETVKSILKLNPLTVVLTGGEPTLNPHIEEIVKLFSGKIAMTIDTNGTNHKIVEMIPLLKEANVLVRITIDTVDNDILNVVRPPKKMPKDGYNQVEILKNNIKELIDAGVQVMIHTVLTQYNINKTEEIAKALISLGAKRWHLYGVNYSKKCKDFFEKIKVTKQEVTANKELMIKKYGDKIEISYSIEEDYAANAIVMINSNGQFFIDTIKNGIKYIGKDPRKPTNEELYAALNYKRHIECYFVYY